MDFSIFFQKMREAHFFGRRLCASRVCRLISHAVRVWRLWRQRRQYIDAHVILNVAQ